MPLGKCGRCCVYPDGDSGITFEDVSAWVGKRFCNDRVSPVDAGGVCLLRNAGYISWSCRCCPENRKTFSRGIDTVYGKSICREEKESTEQRSAESDGMEKSVPFSETVCADDRFADAWYLRGAFRRCDHERDGYDQPDRGGKP